MTTTQESWNEVGDSLSALGLKLKLHLDEELSDREEADDLWERVRGSLEDVVEALGDASRDPAVRADLRQVADALASAANATVTELRAALRRES
jgi:hypothetical protein